MTSIAELNDSVVSAIVASRLRAIVDDMGSTLSNTSRSSRISVRRQFGCALLDAEGRVTATDNPRYLTSLGGSARACIDAFRFDLADDDVLLTNDPFGGGSTVHHMTIVAPLKSGRLTSSYVAVQAHVGDVGGWLMGNYYPDAHEARTEGVLFSPMRIVRFGRPRRDVIDTILLNSRQPDALDGDIRGMLAALERGRSELGGLAEKYGLEAVQAGQRSSVEYARSSLDTAFRGLPKGQYGGSATFRSGETCATVEVVLDVSALATRLDFSKSDTEASIFLNCSPETTAAQALIPLLGLVDEDVPWNDGLLSAFEIIAAPGSVVAPNPVVATGWSFDHVGSEVADAVRQALAKASPEKAVFGLPSRDMAFTVRKEMRIGSVVEQLGVIELAGLAQPGGGASAAVDGWGQPGPEGLGMLPSIEELEQETKVTVDQMEFRRDSGGPGKFRGAPGITTSLTFPSPSFEHLYAVVGSTHGGSPGVAGGCAGGPGRLVLEAAGATEALEGIVLDRFVDGGVSILIDAPGGGGVGDPRERLPDAVLTDVRNGLLSAESAARDYGVTVGEER